MDEYPSLHRSGFSDITDLALAQVLNNLHSAQLLTKLIDLYKLNKYDMVEYITSPPELFNYTYIMKMKEKNKKRIMILYPDPPLGLEELRLLNEIDKDIVFVTPVMLPSLIQV